MSLFGGGSDEVKIKVSADTSDAVKKVSDLDLSVSKLAKGFVLGNVATDVLRSGVNALTGIIGDSIAAYNESEQTLAQMNAVLTSTGHAAGMSGEELVALASHFQNLTTYEDEAVLGAENILLTFTSISKDIFPAATETVLNMSTALGQDLKSSSIQLGKALQDPIQGVSALQRVGVNFNETQKATIENLVKTGRSMDAQKMILKELSTEFGGSATAAAKTFQGQVTQLKNKLDDLEETVGHALTASLSSLANSFSQVYSETSQNVDISHKLFDVLSTIEEVVASAAVGVYIFGQSLIFITGILVQGVATLRGYGDEVRGFTDGLTQGASEGIEKSLTFLDTLRANNAEASASFDDVSSASGRYQAKVPAAYKESAKASSEAAEKMLAANKAVSDSFQKLADLLESHDKEVQDNRTSVGEAFVKQEETIADLRKRLSSETDQMQRIQLQNELDQNVKALESKRDMEMFYQTEVLEARRRASETDFERTIEDLTRQAAEDKKAFQKKMDAIMLELVENEKKRAKLGVLESQITANTIAETQKRTAAITLATDAQVAQYEKVRIAAQNAYQSTFSSGFTSSIGTGFSTYSSTPAVTKHEFGGLVPGPQGMPRMIMAHGQERVIPAGQSAQATGGSGIVVNFNNLTVSNSSDTEKIQEVLENYFRPLLVNYKLSM